MKTKLLLSLFFCFCLISKAEDIKTHLAVWAKNGTKVAYALTEEPKVTFTETDMVITAKSVEVNYSLENMARFTYESNDESTSINLNTDKECFKLNGETLLFPSLSAKSTIYIYSADGKLVFKKTIQTAGEYSFPLSSLSAGTYLVTVNGITYKIVKK